MDPRYYCPLTHPTDPPPCHLAFLRVPPSPHLTTVAGHRHGQAGGQVLQARGAAEARLTGGDHHGRRAGAALEQGRAARAEAPSSSTAPWSPLTTLHPLRHPSQPAFGAAALSTAPRSPPSTTPLTARRTARLRCDCSSRSGPRLWASSSTRWSGCCRASRYGMPSWRWTRTR